MGLMDKVKSIVIKIRSTGASKVAAEVKKIGDEAKRSNTSVKNFDKTLDSTKNTAKQATTPIKSTSKSLRDFSDSAKKSANSSHNLKNKIGKLPQEMTRTRRATRRLTDSFFTMKRAIIGMGVLTAGRAFTSMADEATTMDNKLRLVTNSAEELEQAYTGLLKISLESSSAILSNVNGYVRLADATKNLNLGIPKLLNVMESLNKAASISGVSALDASRAFEQLWQGLSLGVVRGQDLKSVMSILPTISEMILDYANASGLAEKVLGRMATGSGDVRLLAEQNALTTEVVVKTALAGLDEMRAKSESMQLRVSDATVNLKSKLTDVVRSFEKVLSVSNKFAKSLQFITDNMESIIVTAAALIGALGFGVVIKTATIYTKALKSMGSTLKSILPKIWNLVKGLGSVVSKLNSVQKSSVFAFAALKLIPKHPYALAAGAAAAGGYGAYSYLTKKPDLQKQRRADVIGSARLLGVGPDGLESKRLKDIPYTSQFEMGQKSYDTKGLMGYESVQRVRTQGEMDRTKEIITQREIDIMVKAGIEAQKTFIDAAVNTIFEQNKTSQQKYIESIVNVASKGDPSNLTPETLKSIEGLALAQFEKMNQNSKINHDDHDARLKAINSIPDRINPKLTSPTPTMRPERELFNIPQIPKTGPWDGVSQGLDDVIRRGDGVRNVAKGISDSFNHAKSAIMQFASTGKASLGSFMSAVGQTILGASLNVISGGIAYSVKGALGLASGGSFTVGGKGGMDSQLVQFMATPGERVSVRRPENRNDQAGQTQAAGIKIVNVIDPQEAIAALDSASGEQIILNAIERNPDVVRRLLGGV